MVAIFIFLTMRYRYATLFQTLMGLILFISRAPRNIYNILSRIGLSVAYKTVTDKLRQFAKDSQRQIDEWSRGGDNDPLRAQVVYDNVNKMRRAWQKVLGRQDTVQNGTTAILIKLEDVPPGALQFSPLLEAIANKNRASLTVDDLLADIDWTHNHGIGRGHVCRVALKHIQVPAIRQHSKDIDNWFTVKFAKHRLRLRKSEIQPLRCSGIDESTTVGTVRLLEDILDEQLKLSPARLNNTITIAGGDQLSVDRQRKRKRVLCKGKTPAASGASVREKLELWHMKYNWSKGIFRLHWHPHTGKKSFGLYHDCVLLGREKFNAKKCDFYPAHHILQDRFEALVLDGLR